MVACWCNRSWVVTKHELQHPRIYHCPMRYFTLFTLLFAGFQGFAQGNLQFNQALIVTNTQLTVPVGKVWKIESYTPSSAYSSHNGNPQTHALIINGDSRIVGLSGGVNYNYSSGSHSPVMHSFPIWLPSGTTLISGPGTSMISVLEFNIIP